MPRKGRYVHTPPQGKKGASQRQVGAHTPTRKNKASKKAANTRGRARLRLPHPNTQQQCGGRVSWCRCRTRKEKRRRRGNKKAVHIPSQVQQQKKHQPLPHRERHTHAQHTTAQVYTLQPSTTTSPTPNARKHARPLLRTQKTAPAERTGERQGSGVGWLRRCAP